MTDEVQKDCLEVLKSNLSENLKIKVIALLSKEVEVQPTKKKAPPEPPKTVEGWLKTPTGYKQQQVAVDNPFSLDNLIAAVAKEKQ